MKKLNLIFIRQYLPTHPSLSQQWLCLSSWQWPAYNNEIIIFKSVPFLTKHMFSSVIKLFPFYLFFHGPSYRLNAATDLEYFFRDDAKLKYKNPLLDMFDFYFHSNLFNNHLLCQRNLRNSAALVVVNYVSAFFKFCFDISNRHYKHNIF